MESALRRTTTYIKSDLLKAMKMKAARRECSVSDLVNEALRASLAEDALDLEAIETRSHQPERLFDDFLKEMRKNGRL